MEGDKGGEQGAAAKHTAEVVVLARCANKGGSVSTFGNAVDTV